MPGEETWLRVSELVGELAEFSVADLDGAADQLLRGVCALIGAADAGLGFSLRDARAPADDPLRGWRLPSPYRPYRSGPQVERDGMLLDAWYGDRRNPPLDPIGAAVTAGRGRVHAVMHGDVMSERAWQRSAVYELFDACGIVDRLIGGRPIADDVELLLVLYRRRGEPAFNDQSRARLRVAMSALSGVGRRIARAHGLIDARRALTRREREALRYLLLGLPEKQIAGSMGLSERTLHHHVTAVYQKFTVQSRAELMALFLAPGPRRAAEVGLVAPLSLVSGRRH